MAEWLRCLTWNQMGSSRAGSNPADCEDILPFFGNICRLFRIHAPLAYIKQVFYSFVIMQSWPSGKGVWLEIRWDVPGRFESCWLRVHFAFFRKHLLMIHDICTIDIYYTRFLLILLTCSHGRVVKASDLKSDGIFPRRFESCWLRGHFAIFRKHLSIIQDTCTIGIY